MIKYKLIKLNDVSLPLKLEIIHLVRDFCKESDVDLYEILLSFHEPNSNLYVFLENTTAIGFFNFIKTKEIEKKGIVGYITALYVSPKGGNRLKLFKTIYDNMSPIWKEAGIDKLIFNTTRKSRFWNKLGFELNSFNYEKRL